MKPVKNIRSAWRWFSVQAMALSGAVSASWLVIPEDMRASVPPDWLATGVVVLMVLGIIGRMVSQGESGEQ